MLVRRFIVLVLFFFFKQKTAYEMRISDWSSDVCSSDLDAAGDGQGRRRVPALQPVRRALPDGGLGHAEVPVAGDACGTGVSRQAGEGGGMNVEEASSSSGSSFPRKREPSGLVFRSTTGSAESHWVDQPFGLLRSASAFAGMTAVGWLARACSGQPGFGA